MATKTIDSYKYIKAAGDLASGKKTQEYSFEASVYHDETCSRDNLLNMYRETLASKDLTPEQKEEYKNFLKEHINQANADRQKMVNDVDDKRQNDFLVAALISSAAILTSIIYAVLETRRK